MRKSSKDNKLTDKEIRQNLEARLAVPFLKLSWMSASAFALPWLLVLLPFTPPRSRNAGYVALGLWLLNLGWSVLVYFAHQDQPPARLFKRLSQKEKLDWHRQNTIWFRLWKGGFLLFVSVTCFLLAWRLLKFAWPESPGSWLAIGFFLLAFLSSFLLRRHMFRLAVEGWPHTWWGRLMMGLAIIGPATGAVVGSLLGRVAARILPQAIALTYAGVLALFIAYAITPQIVYDWCVAVIHIQAKQKELKDRNNNLNAP